VGLADCLVFSRQLVQQAGQRHPFGRLTTSQRGEPSSRQHLPHQGVEAFGVHINIAQQAGRLYFGEQRLLQQLHRALQACQAGRHGLAVEALALGPQRALR
jgi:hypothetical protein